MREALLGNGVWIWRLPDTAGGDCAKMAQRCAANGFAHALIKATDGPRRFATNKRKEKEACARLRDAGVQVAGWGFHYGREPREEAMRALEVCTELGHRIFVHNAEKAWERDGGGDAMREYCETIRVGGGDGIGLGLSTFALPSLHPMFPYAEALVGEGGCDFVMPQAYSVPSKKRPYLAGAISYYAQARKELARFKKPVVPTLRAYAGDGRQDVDAIAEDARRFGAAAAGLGLTAWNWWVWQSAEKDARLWSAIGQTNRPEQAKEAKWKKD